MAQQYSKDLKAIYADAPQSQIYRAHLFLIGPCKNGAFIYATDGRRHIKFDNGDGTGPHVYHPSMFGLWGRGQQTVKIGLDSNSIECPVFSDEQFRPIYFPGTLNNVKLMDGIYAGLLGAAPVTVYRATMLTWGVVVGPSGGSLVSIRFVGEVGEVENLGPTRCSVKVRDPLYRLNLDCPNQLIQTNCRWVLYSQGCTLLKTNFTVTNSIGVLVDPRSFSPTTNLTAKTPNGTFAKGIITFTTGANNGIPYAVAMWEPSQGGVGDPDVIILDKPPLFDMNEGDTFSIQQGCSHAFPSCLDFQGDNAYVNFGGQPYTPVPETAI